MARPAGRLQAVEVAEEPPVRLSLELAAGQEVDGLLKAAGITVPGGHGARDQAGLLQLLLLLPAPQVGHGHLQDVGLLLLGVGLLPEELGSQQSFQLLDAGVDAVSAQLLHHRLSQLKRAGEKKGGELIQVFFFSFSLLKSKCTFKPDEQISAWKFGSPYEQERDVP